jgi:shikimate dehydrogenase
MLKHLGVIGYPIEHSLSPAMHNAALAHLGLSDRYVYDRWLISPDEIDRSATLEAAIAQFNGSFPNLEQTIGFSVTIPHKQTIIRLLSHTSEVAAAVGAVNTVWRSPTGWVGDNTDVTGFIAPLRSLDRHWTSCNAVILGNGGAARAVVAGLAQLGCDRIHVVGRNVQNLQAFAQSWGHSPVASRLQVHPWSELETLLSTTHLLVNSTPIGMGEHKTRSPVSESGLQALPSDAIAYDLIYNPRPTLFLQQAQSLGLLAIDGTEMLVQQGAAALSQWLQQEGIERHIPVDVMRQALLSALS